jgi:hypothetical protein
MSGELAGWPTGPAMASGTITVEDYRRALRLHGARWQSGFRVALAIMLVAGLAAIAIDLPWPVGAALLAGAGAGFTGQSALRRNLEANFAQNAAFKSPLEYWWNDEAIFASNAMGRSRRPWGSYVRVREDEDVILMYQADNLFEMLPKAWFSDPRRLEELRRHAGLA